MASSTKPNLVAVATPAITDIVSVRQSGDTRDKRETLEQVVKLVADVVLTRLDVDNLRLDGNALSSLTGNIALTTAVGGAVVLTATGDSFMEFNITGNQTMYFKTQNTDRWTLDLDGHLTGAIGRRLTVQGRFRGSQGSNVASANDITLGGNGNYFVITGTTTINTIASTDWTAGSVVFLEFNGSLTVAHSAAGTGASLALAGAANFSATAGDTLTLLYNGTVWRELARTVI